MLLGLPAWAPVLLLLSFSVSLVARVLSLSASSRLEEDPSTSESDCVPLEGERETEAPDLFSKSLRCSNREARSPEPMGFPVASILAPGALRRGEKDRNGLASLLSSSSEKKEARLPRVADSPCADALGIGLDNPFNSDGGAPEAAGTTLGAPSAVVS